MTEQFLPNVFYTTIIDRVLPLAGRGDVDQIRIAMGPLLHDRPGLAQRLADLQPPRGSAQSPAMTWWFSSRTMATSPRSIEADATLARLEQRKH